MKSLKDIVCGFALILLVAGCADILNGPGSPEARTGKVTLTIGSGPARTVAPGLGQFEKISLSFAGTGGTADLADVDVTGGSVEVELPVGSWDVTARAYSKAADESPAAVSEAHAFSWDGETVSGDTRFVLVPTGTGPGTLIYTTAVP